MRFLVIIFLLIANYSFSQKLYEFDYLLEYESTFYKDSIKFKNRKFFKKDETIKKYYLTNSKKNNYVAIVTELDSLNYKIIFKDQNGIYSNATFLKTDLNKAEFINIECKYVHRYENRYKYQTKNYDFFKLNDTVINKKHFSFFKLESIRPKTVKRKKLGTQYYIIDTETAFHLPVLDFSTAYEEWKTDSYLPNGIFLEKYFIDYYGFLHSKEKLINYWKIDKKIVINNACNYTNN